VFDAFNEMGLADGASDFVIQLVDQYLAEGKSRIAALKDALERRDGPGVRLAAHSLRGASGTVGANRLAAMCEELETLARASTFDGTRALFAAIGEEFTRVQEALLETSKLVTKDRR
jgi:HPt (histidine-containing phosphotransfer) domain-containing protein